MKYKIYIDDEAFKAIDEWGSEHKRFVVGCPSLAHEYDVHVAEIPEDVAHFVVAKSGYKFRIRENKKQIVKGKIILSNDSENDYQIAYDVDSSILDTESKEDIEAFVQYFCSIIILSASYLMYGNILGEKEYIISGKNDGLVKIITFRKYKESVYAVHTSAHKSPKGVFNVRGHFRRYKDGKVIWIDEYMKGIKDDGTE